MGKGDLIQRISNANEPKGLDLPRSGPSDAFRIEGSPEKVPRKKIMRWEKADPQQVTRI